MGDRNLSNMLEKRIDEVDSMYVKSYNMQGDNVTNLLDRMRAIKFLVVCAETNLDTNDHRIKNWMKNVEHVFDDIGRLLNEIF